VQAEVRAAPRTRMQESRFVTTAFRVEVTRATQRTATTHGPPPPEADTAHQLLTELFPICRSITGDGLRRSLAILGEYLPLALTEVPSGTPVFDWSIPDEWNIRDAFIADASGQRVVDFQAHNLHVVSYSVPVRRNMTGRELRPHLHRLPHQPAAIPYVTSYYERNWGFCVTQQQYDAIGDDQTYEVCIDSTLAPGALTYGEALLPGETRQEVLLSSYCCHPSLANNELSGPIVLALLYQRLAARPRRRLTYRFYLGPETIGTLAFLAARSAHLRQHCVAGLVATCCGDAGPFTFKPPRRENSVIERAARHVLPHAGHPHRFVPYVPSGSDERQYCSPGFDLPVGSLMRTMYGTYPEYHTSLDNLDFVSPEALVETIDLYEAVLAALEANIRYRNRKPCGEPHLSKYGLYPALGAGTTRRGYTTLIRYILAYADGTRDLLDIAERAQVPITEAAVAAGDLVQAGLLEPLD
jgi:aminopeptidase-like protein